MLPDALLIPTSDCHGLTRPAGFGPGFCPGPGPGSTFCTPAKPVPQWPGRRVVTKYYGAPFAQKIICDPNMRCDVRHVIVTKSGVEVTCYDSILAIST